MTLRAPRPSRTAPSRRRERSPFDVDRVVLLRIAAAAVAVAFLYLIFKVSMIAFGGTSTRQANRIEHAAGAAAARAAPDAAAPKPKPEAAPAH